MRASSSSGANKSAPVELKLGGQVLRVVTSDREAMASLAAEVETRLAKHRKGGGPLPANAMALVALELAHEVETERAKRAKLERRTRDLLRRSVSRIDAALETLPEP